MFRRLGPVAAPSRVGLRAVLAPAAPRLFARGNATESAGLDAEPPAPARKRRSRKKTTTIDFDDLPAFKVDAEGKSVGPLEDLLELGRGYRQGTSA